MSDKTEDVAAHARYISARLRVLLPSGEPPYPAEVARVIDTLLASHAAQAERIASLESGIRLIRATAQGDGHAHLIVKACDSLISGNASA
jgi:hypothetical protein